ncbi:DUF5606 domain-containing protein [Mesonia ostreae]|uniref:DUF5606 domain-containing protein n=1 Tax=Mesonia ostreae TaxID=861110 RepID=A0ABU2KGN3_9FLAO|nr:DUF5606 domain-containing protein [Mesonia ostreae]MDT0293872.1 DUF5606 domain-containing protein [Mesonia ostreae]
MSLDKVLAISGKPGLYELKAQTRGGFIAESLADRKKLSVSVRHNVSMLSEIAMYTYTEEVPLKEVFRKIAEKEDGKEAISHKESKAKLEEYFKEILPEYDEDRVYVSDIKKVFQWYNILVGAEMNDFSVSEEEESKQEEVKEEASTEEE